MTASNGGLYLQHIHPTALGALPYLQLTLEAVVSMRLHTIRRSLAGPPLSGLHHADGASTPPGASRDLEGGPRSAEAPEVLIGS